MAVITRSAHPSALWPGIKAHFGLRYQEHPPKWSEVFEKRMSDKYEERVVEATGFGLAPVKSEGAPVMYDTTSEGYKTNFRHVVYSLGYIVTEEELEDNQYTYVSMGRSRALAFSMRTTAEIVHANVLNRAFSGSFLGGDGVSLVSNAHPTGAGNASNLITAADLSETSLEDGLKAMMQTRNSRGLNIAVTCKNLIVSTSDVFNAERILYSAGRSGTANNDINAVRSLGSVPGVSVNPYLTDLDAWFLQTDVPEGMLSFWRREVELVKDNDFDTSNAKAKASSRFSCGWGDWRSIFGSAGA
jgi:hypothetical protein